MISPAMIVGIAIAVAGAVTGGAAMSGILAIKHKIAISREVAHAVSLEKSRGILTCNARVAEVGRVHDESVRAARNDAIDEARKVAPTPEAPEAIKALCKASASCRSRGAI